MKNWFVFIFILFFGLGGFVKIVRAVPRITTVEVIVSCGDGVKQEGEMCDIGDASSGVAMDFGTSTCASFNDGAGNPYESGFLDCKSDCSAILTNNCYTCGNGIKEEMEACDGNDFGGSTCQSFGYQSGSLSCTASCELNPEDCENHTTEEPKPGDSNTSGGSSGNSGGGGFSGPGFNNGTDSQQQKTTVTVVGKSYPHSEVRILEDSKVKGIVQADSKGDFYFETTEVTPGIATFSFWSQDQNDLKSTLLSVTFRINSGAINTITDAIISPTIDISSEKVNSGDHISFFGKATPQSQVDVHVHSDNEIVTEINSDENGNWKLDFDTSVLKEDFHTVKSMIKLKRNKSVISSNFSRTISFYVDRAMSEKNKTADLNDDGSIDLADFSILLYHWNTNDPDADLNKDGKTDLIDFSIMMYSWTG